ncbi:NifU family protein [Roseovarius gahaiensis]|uniref:NifU family protein n=1 Tax=Roseovarius gahaiensis TaxID=2716691 RepID=A0A967EG96_9RHOB|nr:NifU family protein [Roseovarius gahaiensis]NHQ74686.1 NifU family protein [Roseovarius gahaiensis]
MSETETRRRIRAMASAHDPATMRFVLDAPVQQGQSAHWTAPQPDVPLAAALFAVPGVQAVHVAEATITVTQDTSSDWAQLKPQVAAAIRTALDASNAPLGQSQDEDGDSDAALLAKVTDLLDRQANPAIAAHGGHVSAEKLSDGVVYLRMSGGCQGCAASAATLRDGIETMLRAALPELRDIVDVTDHEAGTNPFYSQTPGDSPALTRPVPPDALDWSDGDLRIDPDYLARRLGLATHVLVAGLERGDITRDVETRETPSGEVTRLTIRSPQRAWAADIRADGAVIEVPPARKPAKAATPELKDRARAHLAGLPDKSVPIAYGKLARALGLYLPGSVGRVTAALEQTMREDAAAGRPMIAALACARGGDLPGRGFFDLAAQLGVPVAQDSAAIAAYRKQVRAAHCGQAA